MSTAFKTSESNMDNSEQKLKEVNNPGYGNEMHVKKYTDILDEIFRCLFRYAFKALCNKNKCYNNNNNLNTCYKSRNCCINEGGGNGGKGMSGSSGMSQMGENSGSNQMGGGMGMGGNSGMNPMGGSVVAA